MGILGITAVLAVLALLALIVARMTKRAMPKSAPTNSDDAPHFDLKGEGAFAVAAVGESHYQDALRSLVGAGGGYAEHMCHAVLVCEDSNRYDANAVRVDIAGRVVGYLPRDVAPVYRASIARGGFGKANGKCKARIYGGGEGKPSYGVWLDI